MGRQVMHTPCFLGILDPPGEVRPLTGMLLPTMSKLPSRV